MAQQPQRQIDLGDAIRAALGYGLLGPLGGIAGLAWEDVVMPIFGQQREGEEQEPAAEEFAFSPEEMTEYAGMAGVSEEPFSYLYGQLPPEHQAGLMWELEQLADANRRAEQYFNAWQRLASGGYQRSIQSLAQIPQLY